MNRLKKTNLRGILKEEMGMVGRKVKGKRKWSMEVKCC